jgi:hypothetical protein
MINLPPGAEHDPRAPFNEPNKSSEQQIDLCYGCGSDKIEYYESIQPGLNYFYCKDCIVEAWADSSCNLEDYFKENNIKPL